MIAILAIKNFCKKKFTANINKKFQIKLNGESMFHVIILT